MMRRPEFLMMRRPCDAMRCHRKNPGRTASILLLSSVHKDENVTTQQPLSLATMIYELLT
jgi:hypothetical protein